MEYIEFNIKLNPRAPFSEILSAKLNEIDFEAYVEEGDILKAYIQSDLLNLDAAKQVILDVSDLCKISYTFNKIEKKNWNQEWENSFKPVFINNNCLIRADFHKENLDVEHEIIITPKMSFGTGHHETTSMIMNRMFDINFKNKSVLDIGTGTGVLAILASKLKAKKTVACDVDEWAYKNAIENSILNSVSDIDFFHGDHTELEEKFKFDIVLVNINTNTILKNIDSYIMLMSTKSQILLSGFLDPDVKTIKDKILDLGFKLIYENNKNKWQMLHFIRE